MSRISSASIFEPSDFALELSKKLLSFSENEKFSDICIISCDDVKFHAHKCVLSAFSDYFMVMFESGLKEATASEIKIHDVNGNVLKLIMTFLYTGRINFQYEQVEDILVAANFFQIQNLIDDCIYFMDQNMDAKNCLEIAMFADKHGFIELFDYASSFAAENFEKVFSCNDFLKLDDNMLSAIVLSECLCVNSEEAVFLKLIEWIEDDKPNREKNTCILFSKIRYWLLSPEFIKKHRYKLPSTVECLEMICTWLEWHSLPNSQRELKDMNISKPKNKAILLVGGGGIQTYDPILRNWCREEVSQFPNRFDSIVFFNNKLVFSTEDCYLKSFDLQTKEITNFETSMYERRRGFGMAVLNKELYVIGNIFNGQRNVAKYNSTNRQWQNVAPLNNIIGSLRVAVSGNKLYVIGLQSTYMACLDSIKNEWTFKAIPQILPGCGFTRVNRNLYLIGGKGRIYRKIEGVSEAQKHVIARKHVLTIDEFGNTCTQRAKMNIGINDPLCIELNNRLITCGGFDTNGSHLNLVHEYHPNLNEWRTLPSLIEYNPLESDYGLVQFSISK